MVMQTRRKASCASALLDGLDPKAQACNVQSRTTRAYTSSSPADDGKDDLVRAPGPKSARTMPTASWTEDEWGMIHLSFTVPPPPNTGDLDPSAPTVIHIRTIANERKIRRHTAAMQKGAILRSDAQILRQKERSFNSDGGWNAIIRDLDQSTPEYERRRHWSRLDGPRGAIFELYHELLNSSTFDIDPEPPVYIDKARGQLKIRGTQKSVMAVQERLQEIQTRQNFIHPSTPMEHVPNMASTGSNMGIKANVAPRWTRQSLLEYVMRLTRTRKRASEVTYQQHFYVVERLLLDVLVQRVENRPSLSYAVFHRAISYTLDRGRVNKARELLQHMERIGFAPNVHTYNLFLYSCATEQNLLAFRYYQRVMSAEGVAPNTQTWLLALLLAPTMYAKQMINRRMVQRGIDPWRPYSVEHAHSFVPFSFDPFLDSGGSATDFVAVNDKLLGTSWLTEATVSFMIDALCFRGDVLMAVELIDLYVARNGALSGRGVLHRMLIQATNTSHNVAFIVWLFVYATERWIPNVLDHIIAPRLFYLATRAKAHNVQRVVWKYAATRGDLTHEMRRKVILSLEMSEEAANGTRSAAWKASYGAVACGVTPADIRRLGTDEILTRERMMWTGFKSTRPFIRMLAEAFVLDESWKNRHPPAWTESTEWKVANAIEVPMREAPGGKGSRRLEDLIKDHDI